MQDRPLIETSGHGGHVRAPMMVFDDVGFSVSGRPLLAGVTLDVAVGGPLVLVGPNGAGKSTLLRLAMGLIAPTHGRIREAGRAPGTAAWRKALVFQKPVMLRRSAADNVAFALAAADRSAGRDEVDRLLARVGLVHLADRPARSLSGGEQQRLAMARALAREPDILLLDEPTASLDPHATHTIERIIAETAASGVKVVMATHDLGEARRLAADVALLVKGRLVELAACRPFFSAPATDAARRFIAGELIF